MTDEEIEKSLAVHIMVCEFEVVLSCRPPAQVVAWAYALLCPTKSAKLASTILIGVVFASTDTRLSNFVTSINIGSMSKFPCTITAIKQCQLYAILLLQYVQNVIFKSYNGVY